MATPVTFTVVASAVAKGINPANSPTFASTPFQMLFSVLSATLEITWDNKNSVNDGGNVSNVEIPISIASQSDLKSFLQSCKLTWNSSGWIILSVKVTVDVASKSQEAFLIIVSVATLLITSLNLMFGLTSIPPLAIVEPESKAAEMYFPAKLPA